MKNSNKRVLFIIFLFLVGIFGIVIGYSFAYFAAKITNKVTPTNNLVTTGSMKIDFIDGPEVKLENALPGQYVEKSFIVKNTGTLDTYYDIYLSDLINTFADKTDLVYTLTSSDGANVSTETQMPSVSTKIVSAYSLPVGATHEYTLRIDFKETNNNQDDNKGKNYSSTIRINEVKDPLFIDYIYYLSESDLLRDETDNHNIRYVGSNPNNYVLFNGELWRIIGVMNNVITEDETIKSLVKIVRDEPLGGYSWDTSIDSSRGINQWGESTYEDNSTYEGADLMRELNTDYLGSITVGEDGKWFTGSSNTKGSMPLEKISTNSQKMIENVKWNLGAINYYSGEDYWNIDNLLTPSFIYNNEMQNNNGKTCTSGVDCNDKVLRTTKWLGKVGLIYPSDYAYATSGGQLNSRESCLSKNLMYSGWGRSSNRDCVDNNWLFKGSNYWTISPAINSYGNQNVYQITNTGNIMYVAASNPQAVYPTLYLKSNIVLKGGLGSRMQPYRIEM